MSHYRRKSISVMIKVFLKDENNLKKVGDDFWILGYTSLPVYYIFFQYETELQMNRPKQ